MAAGAAEYHPWIWLTCGTCGERFSVDRDWWAELVAIGGQVSDCSRCNPVAHTTAPPTTE